MRGDACHVKAARYGQLSWCLMCLRNGNGGASRCIKFALVSPLIPLLYLGPPQVADLTAAAGTPVDDSKPYAELWCAVWCTPAALPPHPVCALWGTTYHPL